MKCPPLWAPGTRAKKSRVINQVWSTGNKVQKQADGGENEEHGLVGSPSKLYTTNRKALGGREGMRAARCPGHK